MSKDAIEVLKEFVDDIERVGADYVMYSADWPDLVITYRKAQKVLKAHNPVLDVDTRAALLENELRRIHREVGDLLVKLDAEKLK